MSKLIGENMRYYDDCLCHHGVKGMHWGVRRYQNADGSYTSAGKQRRSKSSSKESSEKKGLSDKQKKAIKIGAATVAAGLAIYGGYKVGRHIKITNEAKKVIPSKQESFTSVQDFIKANNIVLDIPAAKVGRPSYLSKEKSSYTPKEKKFSDFVFERAIRIDADGNPSAIDLPTNKEGYADLYAKKMSDGNKNDYDYWYKYIMNRMR